MTHKITVGTLKKRTWAFVTDGSMEDSYLSGLMEGTNVTALFTVTIPSPFTKFDTIFSQGWVVAIYNIVI